MNTKEAANIIIGLKAKGWDAQEIQDFILFVETHIPTPEEANAELKK